MNERTRIILASLALVLTSTRPLVAAAASPTIAVVDSNVTMDETLAAQQSWCAGLLAVSDANETRGLGAAKAQAEALVEAAYGYQFGVVLFKPTMTEAPNTFRTTRAGAVSYFVGGDPMYPSDAGFALKGWKRCEVENVAVFIRGDLATTMGNVRLVDKTGAVTVVDKSWQFLKDQTGHLRIVLHHSSLPYAAR